MLLCVDHKVVLLEGLIQILILVAIQILIPTQELILAPILAPILTPTLILEPILVGKQEDCNQLNKT